MTGNDKKNLLKFDHEYLIFIPQRDRSLVYISLRDQSVASLGPELKSVLNTCSFIADSQTVFYDVARFEGTPEHIVLQ